MPGPLTVRDALTSAIQRLQPLPTAGRDAEWLLMHVLACTRTWLFTHPEARLAASKARDYERVIARRAANEPVQYITGQQEFYGLPFRVTPAVLIPRPETEHLVEAALARLPPDKPLSLADVGTGSGAIAVALAHSLPLANVIALDLSPAALSIAHANAAVNRVASRIRFVESDLLWSVAGQHFDAIISNPPYIPESDRATLEPQVRDFEPATALFSGPTGLEIYRRLIPQAHSALVPGGWLLLEIGYGQQPAIEQLLASPTGAWSDISFLPDLQSIPRVVLARRMI